MPSLLTAALLATAVVGAVQIAPPIPNNDREMFVSICVPRMSAKIKDRPETVCRCLHDDALSKVEDTELRTAMVRGVQETGVPSVQYAWVPSKAPEYVIENLDKIAAPTLACMFDKR